MTNYCSSVLIVAAPSDALDGILSAMEGPRDWFFPEGLVRSPAQTLGVVMGGLTEHDVRFKPPQHASAHALLAFEAALAEKAPGMTAEAWRAERDRRYGHPLPAWLPLTSGCIARMAFDSAWPEAVPTSPLSMPRLLEPYGLNEEAFRAAVGDLARYDGGWVNGVLQGDAQIVVRQYLLNTKWAPLDPERDPAQGIVCAGRAWSFATLRYTTAWGPLANLDTALSPLLEGREGRALLVWQEEGGHQGFEVFCPDEGISSHADITLPPVPDGDGADETYFAAMPTMILQEAKKKIPDRVLVAALDTLLAHNARA